MKAMVLQGSGGFDNLKLVERPIPEPGRGEIVVRTKAASINYRDLDIVRGTYHTPFPLPLVPLSDGVGEVVAIGEGVSRVALGDRVSGAFWQGWIAGDPDQAEAGSQLGGPIDGMLAEYVRFHQQGVVKVPAHLTDVEAATLPCAAVTAWYALVTEGRVQAGDTVLIEGTGGVSIFALQFAAMSGARTIVTSSSDAKLERAKALGASEVINYRAVPEWQDRVRDLTEGRGVDHVIEVGGPDSFAKALQVTRPGGQINVIGYVGGHEGTVNPLQILSKRARLRGIPVGHRSAFEAMNRAIAHTKMRPVVDQVFPWTDAAAALRTLEAAGHFGKIALSF